MGKLSPRILQVLENSRKKIVGRTPGARKRTEEEGGTQRNSRRKALTNSGKIPWKIFLGKYLEEFGKKSTVGI